MFEAAELGRKVSKQEFAERERDLQTRLLAAQQRLTEAKFPVIVVVSGVEGSGKGDVVSRLHGWLDAVKTDERGRSSRQELRNRV